MGAAGSDRPGRPVSADGPTVVVCDGHRCRALRDRTDTGTDGTLLDLLGEEVRRTRGAVLIRSACLGVCAAAPAVLVIRDCSPYGATRGSVIGPVENRATVGALMCQVRDADATSRPGRRGRRV
jgi:hypothetical protein